MFLSPIARGHLSVIYIESCVVFRCDIDSDRVATWWSDKYFLKFSSAVAAVLSEKGLIDIRELDPHR